MIIAHHLIWTAYGVWPPNDPRGSGSRTVRAWWLSDLGKVHHGRKARQPTRQEVREFQSRVAIRLQHDVLLFDAPRREAIAAEFAKVARSTPYTCFACAIMPDHVHLVVRRHRDRSEAMIDKFQAASRAALIDAGLAPPGHPVWGVGGYHVFLDRPARVRHTIAYVDANPDKDGLERQSWPFVVEYAGWRPHVARRQL